MNQYPNRKVFSGFAKIFFGAILSLAGSHSVFSQCNVNEKYDKIVSGYHSSIALKDNGTYAVWGSSMSKTGAADVLAPQDINAANYGFTGTVLKAALGGKSASTAVDQGILLTTTGLWAWGIAGNVVGTGVKNGAAFGRTNGTGTFNSYGLPDTITPAGVKSLFATYQTLVILTNGGDVWMLTQTSLALEANGGTVTNAGSSTWKQVKINSNTNLTDVIAVRGQVTDKTYNAFIALTSTGKVYTWGNSTYLGDSTGSAARNYGTQMTLPLEFNSSIPKMIGVTGGTGIKNTYYILSNAGNLYALGDNTQKQCGDFINTTTDRLKWVNVKKSATAGDNLTNINSFSCQEHNSSYPAAAAITNGGQLYTWGNNSSGMCGRTDNGQTNGTLTTVSFDPGIPVGFSGKAITVEMGGHTMVYTTEGSTKFCYVGHYTNGSMGDGTANNNGSPAASSLKHDCSSTPAIAICGYVPVSANAIKSTIVASPTRISADGASTTTLTIQLKDATGVNLTSSGGVVTVSATAGVVGTVIDNNNGTYTVLLTSSNVAELSTISFAINGTTATSTAEVEFYSALPLSWLHVKAYRQHQSVAVSWATASESNVSHFAVERSLDGVHWKTISANIRANNTSSVNNYYHTDNEYHAERLYYRIKQYDADGRSTVSMIVTVLPDGGSEKITIYPVPATSSFRMSNVLPEKVKQIKLVSVSGAVVKIWKTFQSSFDIQDVPAGIYVVQIETNDGRAENLKLNKR